VSPPVVVIRASSRGVEALVRAREVSERAEVLREAIGRGEARPADEAELTP
jgi:hypothetical protein